MAQADGELTVAQRLGRLLDRGLLPAGGPAEAAERLVDRLERPARVALLGLPGSGKSAVLNLLTGTIVVPETLRLPTIDVQYAAEERMLCTLADGTTEIVPGRDLSQVLTLNPALVTVEANLPALKVISLLEVSAGPMEAEQRRAAVWASKRADILIWCTTSYLPKEQQVWEGMPDMVKDNGFLFLTKVDLLGSREAAQGMLERVELRAGEEFRQVLAISAKQARTALAAPGGLDREMFRDSGAAAVITTIKTRVQMARRADTDMAELLIARHASTGELVTRRFAETEQPVEKEVAPEWTPPPETGPEPARPATPAAQQVPPPEPEPAPTPEPVPIPSAEPQTPPEPEAEVPPPQDPLPDVESVPEPGPLPEPEPEPEPEPVPEPEPSPEPEPVPEPAAPSAGGRKRFADRIKQIPTADDAAAAPRVPLRTTWKSKAETAAQAATPARPDPAPETEVAIPAPAPEPVATPAPGPEPLAALENEPPAMSDSVRADEAGPAPVEAHDPDHLEPEDLETEALGQQDLGAGNLESEDDGPDDAAIAAMLAKVSSAPTEERKPRDRLERAERPMPSDDSAPAERSARTSLFGARKATPEASRTTPAASARPGVGSGRPGEPVTRVRAPAPRPAEAPRPVTPAPEEFASARPPMPRQVNPSPAEADPARNERRSRPRIAARVVSVRPAPAAAPAVSGPDQEMAEAAIALIVTRAADLAGWIDPNAKVPVDQILDHSRETTEKLMEIVSRGTSAEARRIKTDLGEIQDLIMLMQLEKGHAPADDAITLLLQIRRDLETLRAA